MNRLSMVTGKDKVSILPLRTSALPQGVDVSPLAGKQHKCLIREWNGPFTGRRFASCFDEMAVDVGDRPPNKHHTPVTINIAPAQSRQFTRPHASEQGESNVCAGGTSVVIQRNGKKPLEVGDGRECWPHRTMSWCR